jgi:hypothetical protein
MNMNSDFLHSHISFYTKKTFIIYAFAPDPDNVVKFRENFPIFFISEETKQYKERREYVMYR